MAQNSWGMIGRLSAPTSPWRRSAVRISETRPGERPISRASWFTPYDSSGNRSKPRATSRPVPLKISTTLREGGPVLGRTSAFTKIPAVRIHRCPRRSSQAILTRLNCALAASEMRSATMIVGGRADASWTCANSAPSLSRTTFTRSTAKGVPPISTESSPSQRASTPTSSRAPAKPTKSFAVRGTTSTE